MRSNEFLLQSCRKEGVNSVLNPFRGKGADFEIYFIEILEKKSQLLFIVSDFR